MYKQEVMEKIITLSDIENMDRFYRMKLINQLSGVRPAHLIGTIDSIGRPNLAIFNSIVHIGANPPCLGFVLRPTTVDRHTYQNIQQTGVYTLNSVEGPFFEKAHQTSAKYPADQSEFDATGLTADFYEGTTAPFVAESTIKLSMEFREEHLIQANGTRLIVGQIKTIILSGDIVEEDGGIDFENLDLMAVSGLGNYYHVSGRKKMPYARVNPKE